MSFDERRMAGFSHPPPMAPPSAEGIRTFAALEFGRQACGQTVVSLVLGLVLLAGGVSARELRAAGELPPSPVTTPTETKSPVVPPTTIAEELPNLVLEAGAGGPTLLNLGTVAVARTYVSIFDAAPGAKGTQPLRTVRIDALEPRESRSVAVEGCLAPLLRYVADPAEAVHESDEKDNVLEVDVLCPNLVVREEARSVAVHNAGSSRSTKVVVEARTIDAFGEEARRLLSVGPLEPGDSVPVTKPCAPGTYVVTADSTDELEEFEEADNTGEFEIACPNLTLVFENSIYSVLNNGAAPAGAFTVHARRDDGTVIWKQAFDGLTAGESQALPPVNCSDRTAVAVADVHEEVPEESEDDNRLQMQCTEG